MRVEFFKDERGRVCGWYATPAKRRRFQGTIMAAGADLPHDLATFVVEAALGLDQGFWNLVANGATFSSIERRRTRQGRQLIRDHLEAIDAAEGVVNAEVHAWRRGEPSTAGAELDAMLARWRALPPGEFLTLEWPARRLPRPRADRRPERNGARRTGDRSRTIRRG
jgi:hypothetical protein